MSGQDSVHPPQKPAVTDWVSMGGAYRVRLRETHVRDNLALLLTRGSFGTVKMDLVLRGLAEPPGPTGEPGRVPDLSWSDLHDFCRDPDFYSDSTRLKRKWVNEQIRRLEQMVLLTRSHRPGASSALTVLRDDRSGLPFDDPTGHGADSYVTTLGSVIEHGRLRTWKGPSLAAYLCALTAERYARSDPAMAKRFGLPHRPYGSGIWYRPLDWFSDPQNHRPAPHVRYPISTRTLRRGVQALMEDGLIETARVKLDPRTGHPYEHGPRTVYFNYFNEGRRQKQSRGWRFGEDKTTAQIWADNSPPSLPA